VLTHAVTELYLGHWDGYAWSRNNYFIHHELEADKWTFLPWGIDQLFEDGLGPFAGVMREPGPTWGYWGGRVHDLCIRSPLCRSRLHTAFTEILARVEEMDLAGLAEQARSLVEPLLLAESSVYGDPQITTAALDQVQSFLSRRDEEISAWLPCLIGGSVDHDLDGSNACTADCDDMNPMIHPGATETCNLADDDCNGVLDDPAHCPRCIDEVTPDGLIYGLCFDRLSWPAARQSCQALGRELASLHSQSNFEHLSWRLFDLLGVERAWIGLNDRETEDSFQWSDDSAVDFTRWASDSPKPHGADLDCVVNAPWGWSDEPCEQELAYLCSEAD